jgi:hypothetical protein
MSLAAAYTSSRLIRVEPAAAGSGADGEAPGRPGPHDSEGPRAGVLAESAPVGGGRPAQVLASGPRICPGFSSESLSGPPKSPVIGEL